MIPKSGYRFSEKIMLVNSVGFHAVPLRALRLAVQDIALSRRKHGFDSRRARHTDQRLNSRMRLRVSRKCPGNGMALTCRLLLRRAVARLQRWAILSTGTTTTSGHFR